MKLRMKEVLGSLSSLVSTLHTS